MENNEKQTELQVPDFVRGGTNSQSSWERKAMSGRTQPLDTEAVRRQMRENYKKTKSQSVKSSTTKEERSTKKKKHISKTQKYKRELAIFGLGMVLGGIAVSKVDNVVDYFEQQAIVADVLDDYEAIVLQNQHLVLDENNSVKYTNGETSYWYDSVDIGIAMKHMLEEGKDEREVVYGIYSSMVNISDDLDDFYSAMKTAGLSYGENEWAHEHKYENMDDKTLKEHVKTQVFENYKITEYQNDLNSMFSDTNVISNDTKSIGGK